MVIKTLRQYAKDLKLFFKSSISHETVRKALMSNKDELYKKWDFELSGYQYCDAQWIPKGKKFEFRLVLIDIVNYLPVAEAVVKSEDDETIYDFINKSIAYHKRKAIVTDSKKSYDDIMRKLEFKYYQDCVFHLLQRINKLINNEVNDYKKEFKADLKKTNPNYSDSKINKLTKKAGKI